MSSNKAFSSIWGAAFPKGAVTQMEQPIAVSVTPDSQAVDEAVPVIVGQFASVANSNRWEPFPGQKLLIGSVLAIPVGIAVALGYNIGLPLMPGDGVQMAWGGLMGVFAHLRLRKMAG